MSVPAPREPGQGGRWETIRYALDTNPRTFRLCLILSVAAVAPCLGVVIAEMIRHMLLRGSATASASRTACATTCFNGAAGVAFGSYPGLSAA